MTQLADLGGQRLELLLKIQVARGVVCFERGSSRLELGDGHLKIRDAAVALLDLCSCLNLGVCVLLAGPSLLHGDLGLIDLDEQSLLAPFGERQHDEQHPYRYDGNNRNRHPHQTCLSVKVGARSLTPCAE